MAPPTSSQLDPSDHWLVAELERCDATLMLRRPATLDYTSPTRARLDGTPLTVFCSNDYLGLRFDPRLASAAALAAAQHGTGAGASRLVSGDLRLYETAEAALARLVHRPAALLTSSGFATNAGVVPSLVEPDDVLFSDALNHASLVDGCRLARARTCVVPHADPDALAQAVARHRPFRRGWFVTESLFSMDGDAAPLADIRAICDRHGLQLYVDEAHAVGVFGAQGEGLVASQQIRADVLIGTLGKALGTAGAFVAGSAALRLYLWNRCRSFVFSTGVAPPVAAAAGEAARIAAADLDLRTKLRTNVRRLRDGLARLGLVPRGHPDAPIVPVVLGDEAAALALAARLREDGFFVPAIRPPTVPRGTARLRITVTASHSEAEIDDLLASMSRRL